MLKLEKRKITLKGGKTGTRYYMRGKCTYTGEHVRESLGTGDRQEAADKLAIEVAKRRQRALHGDIGAATFAEAVVVYLRANKPARFLDPLLDEFGTKPLRDITDAMIADFAERQYPGAKPATIVRQVFAPLSAVWSAAVDNDPPLAMPRKFKKPSVPRRVPKYLRSDADLEAVLKAIPDPRRRAGVLFMSFSGARSSEVVRVTQEDHDAKAATITIGRTKNGDPAVVALPGFVNDVVAMLPRLDRHEALFGFPHRFALYDEIKRASKRAGVPFLSPHRIGRHSFAARLLRDGVSLAGLKEAGRWRSFNAVSVYAHIEKSETDRVMREVSTPLNPVRNPPNSQQRKISLTRKPLRRLQKKVK